MDFSTLGKGILILGLVLVLVGGLFWVLGRAGLPLGRLPGDLRIERDGFSCLMPIASMILVSILLTVLLNIVIRLFNR
ncbi:MAG: DUF2905 domain-containing protein [Anaerolineae bacterium]|jgi:hypothetical protein